MNQSSNELSQELASISETFTSLGERLLGAARKLHAPGSPPAEELIEELSHSRSGFLSLRDRTRKCAESLHVAMPSDNALDTVQGLTAVLDLVAEAEIQQAKGDETRRRSLTVLERVMALKHTGGADFAPLQDCQDLARGLHQTIEKRTWRDLPAEADELAEGDHVFSNLVALVQDREVLEDEVWAAMHDSVGEAFGKSLAAAAARSKLVLPPAPSPTAPEAAAATESRSPASGDKMAAGRRNLGKATSSPRA